MQLWSISLSEELLMWKITGNRWTTESCMSGQVPVPPLGPWFAVPNCALARGFRAARDFPRCVSRPGRPPSRCTGTSQVGTGLGCWTSLILIRGESRSRRAPAADSAALFAVAVPAALARGNTSRGRKTVRPTSTPAPVVVLCLIFFKFFFSI